jgi:glucosamine-6-phosphate deaminase
MNPASILQMHNVAKIVVDEAASTKLRKRDYYRYVFENKPEWQRV